jgi:Domain of unknown function (DUF4282)
VSDKGFFASLFDLSFTSLITTRIIKVVYVLSLIGIVVTTLYFVFAAFQINGGLGVVTLFVLAPLTALLYVIYTRVFLELVVAIIRIAEYNRDALGELRAARGGSTG